MKICAAQTRPFRGDVESNIERHKKLLEYAVSEGAEIVIFPELSITGYEPELAKMLAANKNDERFDDLQDISNVNLMTIGVGMPVKNGADVSIGMILFQPHEERQIYSKQYLHADEEPFFVSGQSSVDLIGGEANAALAICYELSVPEHSENAVRRGAGLYLTSVAKTAEGVEKAAKSLSDIAAKYAMPVLMSNCVGLCDNFESAGRSAVWDENGMLVDQLDDTSEGIIIFDTETRKTFKISI